MTSSNPEFAIETCYSVGHLVFLKGHIARWTKGYAAARLTGLPYGAFQRTGLVPTRYDASYAPFWTGDIDGVEIKCYMDRDTPGSSVFWYFSCVYFGV